MNTRLKTTVKLSQKKLNLIQSDIILAHRNYESALLRRALFKTSNPETSQDLVQTTFLKTLVYLQKGGKIDLMRSFLNHILNALIIDEYRKHKVVSLDSLMEKGFDAGSDEYEKVVNYLDGKEVVLLIPQLPKKYETIIQLRYVKGLSLKEIALITRQSENTVAVQVHRGLAKLKVLYTERFQK